MQRDEQAEMLGRLVGTEISLGRRRMSLQEKHMGEVAAEEIYRAAGLEPPRGTIGFFTLPLGFK